MTYSVAMCTYNGEKFLRYQIDSIVNQKIIPNEIIICDDGSTDATQSILAEYQGKYPHLIKVYHNEENLRSVKNFEKAISLCTQEVIFLSDQDDIWGENKAETMLKYFEDHPNIDVLATNGFCIDERGEVSDKYALWDAPQFLAERGEAVDYYRMITHICNIATGASMAFRSRIKPNIIPFPVIKGYHHDEWIATIAARYKAFEFLRDKLFYYRIHREQQVGNVFYDKTERNRERIFRMFSFHPQYFWDYKSLLKKMSKNYIKAMLIEKDEKLNKDASLSQNIKKAYGYFREELIKKYPVGSRILFFLDKITSKRRIKS